MFGPPSVSFKVDRSWWQTAVGTIFGGFGAVTTLGMALSPHHFSLWAVASAGFAWTASVWMFYRAWRDAPVGTLQWDGAHWHWADGVDYSVTTINVAMDLQRWVLIRLERASASPVWLWLEQGTEESGNWIALRRALVYATRRIQSSDVQAQGSVYP
jgi:hypothetical protein